MNELKHYGVPGMKWGKRKATHLTDRQIKKYAKKGYSEDAYNKNKSSIGKAYDKFTGANKNAGKMMYDMSSKSANKARAEQYLKQQSMTKRKIKDVMANGKQIKAAEIYLTNRQISKYAKKGYSEDALNSNKSKAGRMYDRITGANKSGGDMMYNMSSDKANKARAQEYVYKKELDKLRKKKR